MAVGLILAQSIQNLKIIIRIADVNFQFMHSVSKNLSRIRAVEKNMISVFIERRTQNTHLINVTVPSAEFIFRVQFV